MSWQRIDLLKAVQLIETRAPALIDMRDERSFSQARIPGAQHLDNQSARQFVDEADKDRPVLVYCYHGNSSQGAAAWLSGLGFEEVYSLDGGFELWRQGNPIES
jgi:thiosulfate sulfurtransferase